MRLMSDVSVLRLSHEVITKIASLSELDKKSIEDFLRNYKRRMPDVEVDASNNISAEDSVTRARISLI